MSHIKENILQKIQREKLATRPRLYFTLQIAALVALSVAILLISIFIINFILFSIRLSGQEELLQFGPRGLTAFLRFFPWSWLIIDVIFIGFLQHLLRKFKFGYRTPVLYLIGGIALVTLFLGFAFDRGTDFNDRILQNAEQHRFASPIEKFYGSARRPVPPRNGVCRCTIVSIENNVLIVEDTRFGTTTLFFVILPQNNLRATTTNLKVGDMVFIAGEHRDNMIEAFGVKKVRIMPPPNFIMD